MRDGDGSGSGSGVRVAGGDGVVRGAKELVEEVLVIKVFVVDDDVAHPRAPPPAPLPGAAVGVGGGGGGGGGVVRGKASGVASCWVGTWGLGGWGFGPCRI